MSCHPVNIFYYAWPKTYSFILPEQEACGYFSPVLMVFSKGQHLTVIYISDTTSFKVENMQHLGAGIKPLPYNELQ